MLRFYRQRLRIKIRSMPQVLTCGEILNPAERG